MKGGSGDCGKAGEAGGIELARSPERPLPPPKREKRDARKLAERNVRERDSAAVGIAFKEGKGADAHGCGRKSSGCPRGRQTSQRHFPIFSFLACATAMARFVLPSTRYCLTLLLSIGTFISWCSPGGHRGAMQHTLKLHFSYCSRVMCK